jgi:iron complex transport system substrate-binding protein
MRIVSLTPAADALLADLGLTGAVVGRTGGSGRPAAGDGAVREVARDAGQDVPDEPLVAGTGPHGHVTPYAVDFAALREVAPDVIVTEETCPVCRLAYRPLADGAAVAAAELDGRSLTVVSLSARRLEDALAPIVPVATLLQHRERGQRLLKLRSARLLALGMHVARYVVRTGSERRRVLLAEVTPPAGIQLPGRWLPDMIDAAGGIPLLDAAGASPAPLSSEDVLAARPDVLLLGAFDLAVAQAELRRLASRPGWRELPAIQCGQAWALRFDDLFVHATSRLVEGVEVLLRIIAPEALGANGTPPPPELAWRLPEAGS